ncbi:MAG: 50S ribosomal protein L13 [bacterium]|nr:50S ribosomal protein L13 [bacterium]
MTSRPKIPKTTTVSAKQIKRDWHIIDAAGQIVGRLATQVATFLTGKNKVNFVPNLDLGDFVVVYNIKKIKFTGKKATDKKYFWHTGYPKGLRERDAKWMFENNPEKIFWSAVKNMLPKNKLRKKRLARLKLFADDNHPYKDKLTKSK